MSPTLLRSQLECPRCHEVIASIDRHDFRSCGCGAISLDGGRDYIRVLFDLDVIEEYGPPVHRALRVEQDLPTFPDAAQCMTVMAALARIAPHDRPSAGKPLAMVNNAVAHYIWEVRAKRGRLMDVRVSPANTRRWLELLARNGLVERAQQGRRGRVSWRALAPVAKHPELPG